MPVLGVPSLHPAPADFAAGQIVLTPQALRFVAELEHRFGSRRRELLQARDRRQRSLDAGEMPGLLTETAAVRLRDWQVRPPPADLVDRTVEITGPVDRKMMINALNSGADVFMADFEDSLSPTWTAVVEGQRNLIDAVAGTICHESPDGRTYALQPRTAILMVRPRGWHLEETHATADGKPVSASLFDAGLFLFHCAKELQSKGKGAYLYLPKMESHLEARLWNDMLDFAEARLGLEAASIRVTVLIETIFAAFEMDEILHELRDRICGLNAGRWDYLFSIVKAFHGRPDMVLPDRASLTMEAPFMQAYAQLLVRTCHRRGAHAMGGMSAFVPSRKDDEVNRTALAQVREDKMREANLGFDGTWVAHPDLISVAREAFDEAATARQAMPAADEEAGPQASDLLDLAVPGSHVSIGGVRSNVSVALRYIAAWLAGTGATVLSNLMEDTATAEIARAQLWQWARHNAPLETGDSVTAERVRTMIEEEVARAQQAPGGTVAGTERLDDARGFLLDLCMSDTLTPFLTVAGLPLLEDVVSA